MKRIIILLLLVVFSTVTFAGRKVSYPAAGTLVTGETTYEQTVKALGKPTNSEISTTEQGVLTDISYTESTNFIKGVLPMRRLALYFQDNILVGYDWESNFKEDSTDFDETKASQIKKGETTWQQVAALIGTKYGLYTYPRTDRPDEKALIFMFVQSRTEMTGLFKAVNHIYSKVLTVTYGKDDVVKDFSLSVSGER